MLVWQTVTPARRFEARSAQCAFRALAALAPLALSSCSGSTGTPSFDTGSADSATNDSAANMPSAGGTAAAATPTPGTASPGDPSSAAGAVPATAGAGRPTYHVPVPAELEPYANFDLTDLRFRDRGGEWELEYSLPVLLVGNSQGVSFRGVADANGGGLLRGDAGQVTCRSEGAGIRCDEVLAAIELDSEKLERALSAFSADESAARRAVAQRFSDDPIGVLTFPR